MLDDPDPFLNDVESKEVIQKKIERAEQSLERILGFVRTVDDKASIVLTMVGVVLTLSTTLGITKTIENLLNHSQVTVIFISVTIIFLFVISVCGIYYLMRVIWPRTAYPCEESNIEQDSKIYPGGIASNKLYSEYCSKLEMYGDENYLNDLRSQIYINSKIYAQKCSDFKCGFMLSICGMFSLMFVGLLFGYVGY